MKEITLEEIARKARPDTCDLAITALKLSTRPSRCPQDYNDWNAQRYRCITLVQDVLASHRE